MIGTIEQIINNQIEVKLALDVKKTTNLINLYVLIKDTNKSFIGEITELSLTKCKVNILGKLENKYRRLMRGTIMTLFMDLMKSPHLQV